MILNQALNGFHLYYHSSPQARHRCLHSAAVQIIFVQLNFEKDSHLGPVNFEKARRLFQPLNFEKDSHLGPVNFEKARRLNPLKVMRLNQPKFVLLYAGKTKHVGTATHLQQYSRTVMKAVHPGVSFWSVQFDLFNPLFPANHVLRHLVLRHLAYYSIDVSSYVFVQFLENLT